MDPVNLTTILRLPWPEYVQAVQVHLAARQREFGNVRVSLDEREDATWIATLHRFRAETQAPLVDLTPAQRRVLVGGEIADTDLRFFGHLNAAGRVVQVLTNPGSHPTEVAAIEAARVEAQRLPFRHASPDEVVNPWARIVALPRFGPATASRLLLAERPDLYFVLNDASRELMATITGHKLPQLLEAPSVVRHYREMLEAIYGAPWWRQPPPASPRERLIWDSRVALLDVFAYDAEVGGVP